MTKEFKLRIDVTFSNKNMPDETLNWLQNEYYNHAGNKADFIRKLVTSLYRYETGAIAKENKKELKEEVLGYVIQKLKLEEVTTNNHQDPEEQLVNEVSEEQAKTQDMIIEQLDHI